MMAETLFAVQQAVRISLPGRAAETTYSPPREMEDDQVNAYLGFAITAWSFPAPIPAQNNLVAADRAIGRVMTGKDWSALEMSGR